MTRSSSRLPNRRVRTPTLLQMESVECGAASLGIVMGHFGRWRPLEEIRTVCGVSRDGSKASKVLQGARHYGFAAKGRKAGVDTALRAAFPFIAFWNFNHFLVVEGHRNGKVYLNDPGTGPRTVTLKEFDQSFTGVMLEIVPAGGFRSDPRPPGLLFRLAPRARKVRASIVLAALVSLTLVVPGLLVPGFSKIFVDDYLIQGKTEWLRPLLAAMAVTAVVSALLGRLRQVLLLRMETKLALADSARFVWHLLRLPVAFFSQRHAGDIEKRIAANDRIAGTVAGRLGESLADGVTVLFYAAVMVFFDWKLAMAVISLSMVNVVVFRALARRRTDASVRMQQDLGRFHAASVTGIRAIETLKATGTDDDYFERWSGSHARHLNNMRRLASYDVLANAFPPLLTGSTAAVVFGLGGFRVIDGAMTVGTLVAFLALIQSFTGPIDRLVAVGGAFQALHGDLARSDDVFRHGRDPRYRHEDDRDERASAGGARLTGDVELREVSFGYTALEPPVIQDVSLTLRPGARVALVGGSGSGKTTLARLISGLYQPWGGDVLFDGVTLRDVPVASLTDSIASVSQDAVLFGGSVRDNVSLWDTTLADGTMIGALRDAEIHGVVAARGGALEADIEEGGANFSGGETQRLEIARALAADPSILILDEATSALDPATEERIDEQIRRRGCTCVIVAHRLSTIRDADEIVVLERGRVVERGTHDELIVADGPYAALIAQE